MHFTETQQNYINSSTSSPFLKMCFTFFIAFISSKGLASKAIKSAALPLSLVIHARGSFGIFSVDISSFKNISTIDDISICIENTRFFGYASE